MWNSFCLLVFFVIMQNTACYLRISDWSSDVCFSDLCLVALYLEGGTRACPRAPSAPRPRASVRSGRQRQRKDDDAGPAGRDGEIGMAARARRIACRRPAIGRARAAAHHPRHERRADGRSEEHTSELQSLMRISYAVFCLNKKTSQSH